MPPVSNVSSRQVNESNDPRCPRYHFASRSEKADAEETEGIGRFKAKRNIMEGTKIEIK